VGRHYRVDPLNVHETSARLAAEAFAEQGRVRRELAKRRDLGMPTLVLHGDDDQIVPARASEPLERLVGVTRRTYPGLRHELHNEPEWESIADATVAWLADHLRAQASMTQEAPHG